MYYKGMWQELKETITNQEIIDFMNELEEKYGDYGEMNKYCPDCGSKMITRTGKYGNFRGCSNFPKCNYHEFYREFGIIKDNKEEKECDKEIIKKSKLGTSVISGGGKTMREMFNEDIR